MTAGVPSHALLLRRTWDDRPVALANRVRVLLRGRPDGLEIRCRAPLCGEAGPPAPPGPTDRLWEHEVVEVFVAGPDGSYTEIEVGPFGNHLVLRLSSYRVVAASLLPLEHRAQIRSDAHGRRWTARALLARELLPPEPHRVNVYAIQPAGRGRRHLAWSPPGGAAPDFHRVESFRPLALF